MLAAQHPWKIFLEILGSDDNLSHTFSITRFSLENYVRLDSAALKALHLLPSADAANKYQSVYGILNHCRTPQGQRLLTQWLRQPLTDIEKINERLDLVETFVCDSALRNSLHEVFLRSIPDLPRLARRLQNSRSNLQDVMRVYRLVLLLPAATGQLRKYTGKHLPILEHCIISPLMTSIGNFEKFVEMVESTVDLDAAKQNEYNIRADFDEELKSIREQMDRIERQIEKEFHHIAAKVNLEPNKTIKLESNDVLGFYLRVTLKMEKHIRDLSWLKKVDMQKAGVRFRSSNMISLNDEHIELKLKYEKFQSVIIKEILTVAGGYVEPLYALGETTACLDVVVSLAMAAVSAPKPYVRPKFLHREAGRISIREARHPCLEMQDGVSVIPNDVNFERGKCIFKTITGPNMGGKSTYIRGVGVLVAMAQAGSFIPCTEAELVPVDAVMARVGAADCQLRGISTFMAEMLETVAVLRLATRDSLVIIDELGRGTSTYDGFGLAWSISSHLANEVKCFTLFATHFHELTSMALIMPNHIQNFRVATHITSNFSQNGSFAGNDENDSNVVMLYKVEPGICDQSYGLKVARSIGLPLDLIADAEAMSSKEAKVESLWVRLEESSHQSTENREKASRNVQSQISTQPLEVDSLNAIVVAERLRLQLLENLTRVIDDSDPTPNVAFSSTLSKLVTQTLGACDMDAQLLNFFEDDTIY